jgi:hypothetical protein
LVPLHPEASEAVGTQDSISHVPNFNVYYLVVLIKVKRNAGPNLFSLDDLGVIEPTIDRAGFLMGL